MAPAAEVGIWAPGGVAGLLQTGAEGDDIQKRARGGRQVFKSLRAADKRNLMAVLFDGDFGRLFGDLHGFRDSADREVKVRGDGVVYAGGELAGGFLKSLSFSGDSIAARRKRTHFP